MDIVHCLKMLRLNVRCKNVNSPRNSFQCLVFRIFMMGCSMSIYFMDRNNVHPLIRGQKFTPIIFFCSVKFVLQFKFSSITDQSTVYFSAKYKKPKKSDIFLVLPVGVKLS